MILWSSPPSRMVEHFRYKSARPVQALVWICRKWMTFHIKIIWKLGISDLAGLLSIHAVETVAGCDFTRIAFQWYVLILSRSVFILTWQMNSYLELKLPQLWPRSQSKQGLHVRNIASKWLAYWQYRIPDSLGFHLSEFVNYVVL